MSQEELGSLLEAIAILQHLDPSEWGPFWALKNLVNAQSWKWNDHVHKSLYLTLVKRAGLANSSSGNVDLPKEALALSYPENQAELEHYL